MKRVFVGSLATETNTFSPLRTDLRDFHDNFYAQPGAHPDSPTLCSAVFPAARSRAKQLSWELIEGTATWAEPGGIVNADTWHTLRDQLLTEIQNATPLDIVLLGLRGAMGSQDCLDCEGELLAKVREIVGSDAVIGATLDPHSHLTPLRVESTDLLVAFKEFPHTDFVETAEKLIKLADLTSRTEVSPVKSVFDCRMIDVYPTSQQPMRSFVDPMIQREGTQNVLSVSLIHGLMAADVPEVGTKVLVFTNNDKHEGDRLAEELGRELFNMRGTTKPEMLDTQTALNMAEANTQGPVVLADVWDNPGGGVPGDSTIVLEQMLARGVKKAALANIWYPIAVRTCFSAGIGAVLPLRFGAKMSPDGGVPIDAEVTVRNLVRDAVQSFGSSSVPMGDAAWITVGGIDVVLSTVRSQTFCPDAFPNLGIDFAGKHILVVKSTNHFQAAFSKVASRILYVAVAGSYPSDLSTNNYTRLTRPIWPRVEDPFRAAKSEAAQ